MSGGSQIGAASEDGPDPVRVGYLGPRGTFSEEALLSVAGATAVEPVALESVYDAVMAVQEGRLPLALVPIENSIEGPLTVTLDTLAIEAPQVRIVGELVLGVHHCLIAKQTALEKVTVVLSHPQASGQCARFLRRELPQARVAAASSTAEAVRLVAEHAGEDWAAIGTRLAAELYGCTVVREGIEDRPDNETRFVWLGSAVGAREARPPGRGEPGAGPQKTSVVFWGPGADRAGWLVRCLDEFARREINLTKIESRPRRERLGHYMFFADLEGDAGEERVAAALAGLEALCEAVRVLGSYPAAL